MKPWLLPPISPSLGGRTSFLSYTLAHRQHDKAGLTVGGAEAAADRQDHPVDEACLFVIREKGDSMRNFLGLDDAAHGDARGEGFTLPAIGAARRVLAATGATALMRIPSILRGWHPSLGHDRKSHAV